VCAAAVLGFGAVFDAFSQVHHPVGMLGATQVPRAAAFNLVAFVVPGLLAAVPALALRGRLADAGWSARIGTQALLLSALAFAAQGLLPLDSMDIDGARSRLHAAAWTGWWLAFAVAAVLLLPSARRTHAVAAGPIAASAAATLALALVAPAVLPPGLAQRLAFGCWFLALGLAGRRQP
jgi:hypothetical protein